MTSRREFLCAPAVLAAPRRRPNVVLIITDDQGYGDVSLHGNQVLQTPNIDRIGREGARLTSFRVSPVCAPTRASLMTGRWNYRTGVTDTYLGRALMRPSEVTLPELLAKSGYRTGIFGKWHLGDNAPLRATDQGFQQAVTIRGGGLAQPSSPPGTGYFDPPLELNNRPMKGEGYCTDIFYERAMEFIETNPASPFFCYISTNAPHTPLEIGDEWVNPYKGKGLDAVTEKIYGMVSNLDHNTGKLLNQLKRLGIERDTMLIFMTDNGPQQRRFNAGLRGLKGSVYDGGIRVPCFIRQPGSIAAAEIGRPAAHVDLMPTILEACGVTGPKDRIVDGQSLLGALQGKKNAAPPRSHFFQWHRGDEPVEWRNAAVVDGDWKLVEGKELYNLKTDPGEAQDVVRNEPERSANLRKQYDKWFKDVGADGYAPPRIWIGSEAENPVLLTRQDWRGERATWDAKGLGHYEVEVKSAGRYQVTMSFPVCEETTKAVFQLDGLSKEAEVERGAGVAKVEVGITQTGEARIEGSLMRKGERVGVHYIEVKKVS